MRHATSQCRAISLLMPVLLAATCWIATDEALAVDKPFGVIDSQRIVDEYPAARDAQEQWQNYVRELEREVADKERALQRLIEEIESQRMLLGEEALSQKLQDYESQKADYFRFREQADQRVQREYQDKIGPIIDQVKTVAERIGKESDFGIIIDSAAFTILYLDPAVDLTNEVLAALARGDRD
jgi:Skp family chaperone for outer membrane proteins